MRVLILITYISHLFKPTSTQNRYSNVTIPFYTDNIVCPLYAALKRSAMNTCTGISHSTNVSHPLPVYALFFFFVSVYMIMVRRSYLVANWTVILLGNFLHLKSFVGMTGKKTIFGKRLPKSCGCKVIKVRFQTNEPRK